MTHCNDTHVPGTLFSTARGWREIGGPERIVHRLIVSVMLGDDESWHVLYLGINAIHAGERHRPFIADVTLSAFASFTAGAVRCPHAGDSPHGNTDEER